MNVQFANELVPVRPVIDPSVRCLCCRPYALHPRGCPNFGKRTTCPPAAPLFGQTYDMSRQVWAVVNEFELGLHVERMRAAHPDWSDRQLRCVLYWQSGAREELKRKIAAAISTLPGCRAETCPEAMGVNVTATLAAEGIALEWPPVRIARQVALIAYPNSVNCAAVKPDAEHQDMFATPVRVDTNEEER